MPTTITLPIKLEDGSVGSKPFPLQLPHNILRYLIETCGLSLPDDLLRAFWDHLDQTGDCWAASTKAFRQSVDRPTWPLGLYGDEACIGLINAPFNKVHGLFLNVVLWRPQSTRLSRFLLFAIESEKILTVVDTLFPVLQMITDSMNQLTEQGIGKIRFLVSEIRGDQAFIRNVFRHRAWWLYSNPCFRCRATLQPGPRNYCLYDEPGGWESTRLTTEDFIRHQLTLPMCDLAVSAFLTCFGGLLTSTTLCNARSVGGFVFLQYRHAEGLHLTYPQPGSSANYERWRNAAWDDRSRHV